MAMIQVENLCKEFQIYNQRPGIFGAFAGLFSREAQTRHAVKDISFEIVEGEFLGYLGPNGAGKSTTIKILTGILHPSSGKAWVNGIAPYQRRVENARQIGVVFGQRSQLWWDLPVIESFELLALMYKVPEQRAKENVARFTELLELEPFIQTPVRKLSLGQKMRCEIAAALLHDPKVLFLDEPTIGLDVVAKHRLRAFLKTLNRQRGTTILLTTHDLDDVEELCRRILVIDRGSLIHDGDLASLKNRFGNTRRLVVDFAEDTQTLQLPEGATVAERDGRRVAIQFSAQQIKAPELITAILQKHSILDLSIQETDIEDVVKRIYQG